MSPQYELVLLKLIAKRQLYSLQTIQSNEMSGIEQINEISLHEKALFLPNVIG